MTGRSFLDLARIDAPLDVTQLTPDERAVLARAAEADGTPLGEADVASLLHTIQRLRALLTGLVRQAGHPLRAADGAECAPVPVDLLERADAETLAASPDDDDRWDETHR